MRVAQVRAARENDLAATIRNTLTLLFFLTGQVCGRTVETGCLFNVFADPGEHDNIAAANKGVWTKLLARMDEARAPYRPFIVQRRMIRLCVLDHRYAGTGVVSL